MGARLRSDKLSCMAHTDIQATSSQPNHLRLTCLILQSQVAQVSSNTSSPPASSLHAMKVQSPPCPWEFYICKVLQGRVAPVSRSLFLSADMLYLLPKHSVMLTPYGRRGTLQDMLNAYLRKGKVSMSCPHHACVTDELLVPNCLSVPCIVCCQPIIIACRGKRQAVCKL